jgi:hypothetical protein
MATIAMSIVIAFPGLVEEAYGLVCFGIPATSGGVYEAVESANSGPKVPEFVVDDGEAVMYVGKTAAE